MKRLFILVAVLAITASATAQIKVNSSGNVGINNANPAYKFDVQGKARIAVWGQGWDDIIFDASNQWSAPQISNPGKQLMLGHENYFVGAGYIEWFYYKSIFKWSDERLKENIKPIGSTLNKLLTIEGKRYNYKKDTEVKGVPDFEALSERETFGFIAQDLEKIFPELVLAPNPTSKYYSVDYIGMIPVLLEAIKEQQTEIECLRSMLTKQTEGMKFLKEQFDTYEHNNTPDYFPSQNMNSSENLMLKKEGKLFQNTPNPFSTNTEIKFEIHENFTTARLLIHDMQGAEIKSYLITTKGVGTITIKGSELQAGMYMYTLLVDNTIVDSKRMILTK